MKITEMMKLLQDIHDEHGDLPVYITAEWTEALVQADISGVHYRESCGSPGDVFPARVDIS